MLNRWVERDGLKDTLKDLGVGSIAFTPLAQGMLTNKYLGGIPADSRAAQDTSLNPGLLSTRAIENIRALNDNTTPASRPRPRTGAPPSPLHRRARTS